MTQLAQVEYDEARMYGGFEFKDLYWIWMWINFEINKT